MPTFSSPDEACNAFSRWIATQHLSANTQRTYLVQVRQYCHFLIDYTVRYGNPLQDDHARDYAVRDYKTFLKVDKQRKPSTVNLALAALDLFYQFLRLGSADVKREALPQQAPRALTPDEQRDFLRAVERSTSVRDRAIAVLLFYTGIRIGECENLNLSDVQVSDRKGLVIIRSGKRDTYREIPLNTEARRTQQAWLLERSQITASDDDPQAAYFLNRYGNRLSTRSIHVIINKLGQEANVELSAHILRHTCLTNLVRAGHDIVLVAEIAGHSRLETTRRYSLPSVEDRAAAMETIHIDY